MTLNPLVWDAQTIRISTVRDGKRKIDVVAEAEPWDGLPVWLVSNTRRPTFDSSLTK